MASRTSLAATVEDSAAEPVSNANVSIAAAGGRRLRLSETVPGQYSIRDFVPGEYALRLSKRGYITDEYEIELAAGANSIGAVLGKPGEPFYRASGFKVYFTPYEDRFLLAAYGDDAVGELDREIADAGFGADTTQGAEEPLPEMRDAALRSISAPADRDTMAAMSARLEARNIMATPALVVERGTGAPLGLTDELFVQFAPHVTRSQADEIAAAHDLEVVREVTSTPNGYLLRSARGPSYELLNVAEELIAGASVLVAEPDLLMVLESDQYIPNDPLFNLLNHLPLINCDDAWAFLGNWLGATRRGGSSDVCIAVFDPHGVAPNHPDLTANASNGQSKLVTSFNFAAMAVQTVAGSAGLGGDHGTQCAGSATAAFDNNTGVAGVAPNCRLIGARIPGVATGTLMADAFLWAAGINNGNTTSGFPALPAQPADVISNSWGVSNAALSTQLRNAFDRLTDAGRGSRGCVVTFSTGNLGYMQFSNVRRFAAYGRTLAVGASINSNPTSPVTSIQADPNGNTNNIAVTVNTRALYNPFGPEMDIVAPSHTCYAAVTGNIVDPTTTTVRVGTGALDGCAGPPSCPDYATTFGGTSHASPTIAGTAALVISVFPILSWDEVRAVLRNSSVRIDAGQTNTVGQYVDNDGDGIDEFSQWYGYGRVDVANAVDEAAKLAVATFQSWS